MTTEVTPDRLEEMKRQGWKVDGTLRARGKEKVVMFRRSPKPRTKLVAVIKPKEVMSDAGI